MLSHLTKNSIKSHSRYFFKEIQGDRFQFSGHTDVIHHTLSRVISGEIPRLIINLPPGYLKTRTAIIDFISHGLSVNPKARFLHSSYSKSLALGNSQTARDIVTSEEYQTLHPMKIRRDANSMSKWWTQYGGGVYAAPSGGQIMGFRAGTLNPGFTGALLLDDLIKADDYFSIPMLSKINGRFTTVYRSRLAHELIPIILVMQRIGFNDPTGFLLNGGTGEKWHHLRLPLKIKRRTIPYNHKKWPYGIEIKHNLPHGPLWETKHNLQQIEVLKVSDPVTYESQYDQDPREDGGVLFSEDNFEIVDAVPAGGISVRGWDLAGTTNKKSAYTVGVKITYVNRLYFIEHVFRIKKGALAIENSVKAIASADGPGCIIDIPQDPGQAGVYQVNMYLTRLAGYDLRFSPESGSKALRISGLAAQAQAGNVKIVKGEWTKIYINELCAGMSGEFVDQIDASSRAFHRIVEEISSQGDLIITGRTSGGF